MGWADKFRRTDSGKGLILNPTPLPPTAYDHNGRELRPGDEVVTTEPQTIWRVVAVLPVLEPGMPPGVVRMRMVAQADVVVQSGERVQGLHRLRTVEELAPPQDGQALADPPEGGQPA